MTTFEAFSLLVQFGLLQIALITLIVTIVVFLFKKSNRSRYKVSDYFLSLNNKTTGQLLLMQFAVAGIRVVAATRYLF